MVRTPPPRKGFMPLEKDLRKHVGPVFGSLVIPTLSYKNVLIAMFPGRTMEVSTQKPYRVYKNLMSKFLR